MARKNRTYTVCDGKITLSLVPAEEGGYVVRSPLHPDLITEADDLTEAFEMAYDALEALRESRKKLAGQFAELQAAAAPGAPRRKKAG